jgi:hypothetical protein
MSHPDPDELLRRRFDRAVERDDPFELQRLLMDVVHGAHDRQWAECCCAQLARHRNANVRGDALSGFGHLARRFGMLDRNRVKRLIDIGLHAHHEYVRDRARSAADDVETFLAWTFDRPADGG